MQSRSLLVTILLWISLSAFTNLVIAAAPTLLRTPVPQIGAVEFEAMVHSDTPILVEFYAPWCHYCKQVAPLYEEAAVQMRSQPTPTQLVKVDCMLERELCARFHVAGFPSIKLIRRAASTDDEKDLESVPLSVFDFQLQRTTLSFLVFCSTVWRTLQPQPFPELETQRRQQLKEEWEVMQQKRQEEEQQLQPSESDELDVQEVAAEPSSPTPQPIIARPEPISSQPPRAAGAGPSNGVRSDPSDSAVAAAVGAALPSRLSKTDLLAGLGRVNLGARIASEAVNGLTRHRQQQQQQQQAGGIDASQAAEAADREKSNETGLGMIGYFFLLIMLIVAAVLLYQFGPLLRSKLRRHHSMQQSKTV